MKYIREFNKVVLVTALLANVVLGGYCLSQGNLGLAILGVGGAFAAWVTLEGHYT